MVVVLVPFPLGSTFSPEYFVVLLLPPAAYNYVRFGRASSPSSSQGKISSPMYYLYAAIAAPRYKNVPFAHGGFGCDKLISRMAARAHLNHIGIAVSQLPELKKLFGLLGLQTTHTEPVPDQGVITHFLPLPREQTQLEFLEVTDPEGTVAKFIQKRGPGIHHLSFEVRKGELDSLCAKLRSEGYKLTYDQPKAGAHGMRVNFIHPATAGGILIEVMEHS